MYALLLFALQAISYPPASPGITMQQVLAAMPQPATTPGAVPTSAGTVGTAATTYALADHTHPSKARRGRVLIPASGTLDITFSPSFLAVPVCTVTAEATKGDTNVVNAQLDGPQTIRINRTAVTNATLIGLSVLAVPTQVATYANWICLEP